MENVITNILPNVVNLYPEMIDALLDTLYMVSISGIISTLIGFPIGVTLVVTRKGGVLQSKLINNLIGKIINIFRSIPFIILLAAIMPITKFIVGTTIGTKGAVLPLVFGSTPFVARQIESVLLDIDSGVIEAAQAMGSSPLEIIYRVMLPEGLGGIIHAITITTVSLIGLSAMAGTVGGGGLGDFAIRYGYQYFQTDVMIVTVIILLVLVNIVQCFGDLLLRKLNH
ncbi:methionine ABC transporter permease [Clostridium sp. ATCC 25772]|uniref:methionine ABC transporter permease n=1 Tax=Clostridium sp. ATCC 25772 TaxID=1676991 RepID=UPI000783F2E2|nr:methionine ABC transporter permease [Clostridium sp. ATCC 25772]